MRLFYEAAPAGCGDFIPFWHDGAYYLFYLHGRERLDVGLLVTSDWTNVQDKGIVLAKGGDDDQDRSIGTGCIVRRDERFHFYYTGFNPAFKSREGAHEQVLMRAVSDDLVHWTKDADWRLAPGPSSRYRGDEAWRDPHIFRNEEDGRYWMILTTQTREGPAPERASERRTGLGCVALFASDDLDEWEERDPLLATGWYDAPECPDLFRIGDWWYLLFSEYRDLWTMHYRMSRSPRGPWLAPADDALDGKAFYAAKTAFDGERRMLVGWTAGKEGGKDGGKYEWGGCLTVHELGQRPDGTLTMRPPDSIERGFRSAATSAALRAPVETIDAGAGLRYDLLSEMPDLCMISVELEWEPGTAGCGLLLHAAPGLNDGYMLWLEPGRGVLKFDRWLRPWDYPAMERTCALSGTRARLKAIRSGTTIAVYVNDETALSARAYELQGGRFGLFASGGRAAFRNVSIGTPEL
ncbi:family 43 glycosylhydrolase [Paenibacillus flagellatus]|nr:family 43 glycosylhydrolase [Paenibacillus flagellatus]